MSSTNRGYSRHKTDYYVTPQKPIKEFLSEFLLDENIDRPDRLIWMAPCAGGDEENKMSYPTAHFVWQKGYKEDLTKLKLI